MKIILKKKPLYESFDFDSYEEVEDFDAVIESHLYKKFLEENYKITGTVKPHKKDGKLFIDVGGDVMVKNRDLTSLTNGRFCFGEVRGSFYCDKCDSLKTLEGAPEKVFAFSCIECTSLTSLKGSPKFVDNAFSCSYCISLTSLEGAPGYVGRDFDCCYCFNLTSLKGAPEYVGGYFNCIDCENLISLNGAPKEVGEGFVCANCQSLTSLKGAPKKVGTDFYCSRCKVEFTKDDVTAVSNVKNNIFC